MKIEEARTILGNQISDLSDQEVGAMIERDSAFMDSFLDLILSNHLTKPIRGIKTQTNATTMRHLHQSKQ